MTTDLELSRKYLENSFGETKFMVDYYFTTYQSQSKNTYLVSCQIGGLRTADLILYPKSAILAHNQESNVNTLTEDAAIELFEMAYIDNVDLTNII